MAFVKAGLTEEQTTALLDIEPARLRELDTAQRVRLALEHERYQTRKREAFWNALQSFATAALPILAFLGITQIIGSKR